MSGVPRPVSSSFTLSAATGVSEIIVDAPFCMSFVRPSAPPAEGAVRVSALRVLFHVHQCRAHDAARSVTCALEARDQCRLALDAVVVRAGHAAVHRARLAADAARVQVGEAVDQLLFELLLAPDVVARLLEFGIEQRAQLVHGLGAAGRVPPALEHLLRVVQRRAEPVQEVDPAHALDHRRVVEPEAAARARRRLDEPQLLIEMDRTHGLARLPGEIADANVLGSGSVVSLRCRHTLTQRLESGRKLMVWMGLRNHRCLPIAGHSLVVRRLLLTRDPVSKSLSRNPALGPDRPRSTPTTIFEPQPSPYKGRTPCPRPSPPRSAGAYSAPGSSPRGAPAPRAAACSTAAPRPCPPRAVRRRACGPSRTSSRETPSRLAPPRRSSGPPSQTGRAGSSPSPRRARWSARRCARAGSPHPR